MQRGRFCAFFLFPALLAAGFKRPSVPAAADLNLNDIRSIYDELHTQLLERQKGQYLDNVAGQIVWGSAYQLDSYLDMFIATGDKTYLDHFVSLADRVMAARADKTGQLDYRGRLTYGWPSGGHYTLGTPMTLSDSDGDPTLEIQTIARSYNNKTSIQVLPGDDENSFSIRVVNSRNPENLVEKEFSNLTLETVEERINPPPGSTGLVRVKRIGNKIPAPCEPFTPPTALMTFHGHHTGHIVTPIARFCDLVLNGQDLPEFEAKAGEFLKEIRITMVEHDQFFVEEEDWGYTIFEKGSPFWCDGCPEVHNTMACSGSAYLYLYRTTGEPYYLERATQLARLFKRNHVLTDEGNWMMYYWWGIMHEGWSTGAGISENLPAYAGARTPEDLSHFQLTLQFILDCHDNGVVFSAEDLEKWAKTFNEVLYREDDQGPHLLYRLSGDQSGLERGRSNHVIYGFIRLGAGVDRGIVMKCLDIFQRNYKESATAPVLLGWAKLARAVRD